MILGRKKKPTKIRESGVDSGSIDVVYGADNTPFTHAQYEQLTALSNALRQKYKHIDGIAGHSEIAPLRKTDPGSAFEWARFERQANIPSVWRQNNTQ